MHAPIRLTPVPLLTQQSHKSRQIGEPKLDGGHGDAVNHETGSQKGRVSNERQGHHQKKKKDNRNYFYKQFLSSGQDH